MTTQSGVNAETAALSLNEDDAAEAFLSRWSEEDPETVSENQVEEEAEVEDESAEAEAETEQESETETETDPNEQADEETETETEDETETEAEAKDTSDDVKVKIKVGDDEHEVSVKDLKRLYGQEAALTKKSQQVAADRKGLDEANQKAAAQLDRIHKKVSERWEPYSKIDMLVASTQLDAESFAALRAEAQSAYDDFQFVTQEVNTFVQEQNTTRQQFLQTQAKEAIKVLKEAIPGWSQAMYNDVREYAIKGGLNAEVVNQMVDPHAIQMLHKAMQFDKAKAVVTKKKTVTPKRVLKTTNVVTNRDTKVEKTTGALKKLRASGSTDDAADLFMARWAAE